MKLKKIAAVTAAAVITLSALSSCGTSIIKNEQISDDSSVADGKKKPVTELSSGSDSQGESLGGAPIIYEETTFDQIDVPYVEYKKTYQAESGTIIGDTASVKMDRASFKGDGYVSGANLDNWSLSFDLPESQFYNITVQTAAEGSLNSHLYINGREVWIFRTSSGEFAEKSLENIWLEEGINEIRLESDNSAVDIDFVRIEANRDISSFSPDLSSAALSNPKADYYAKALYSLLCSNYGKQILTAQHDSAGDLANTETVSALTGKYPAIRCSDIGGYTKKNIKDISKALKYAENGGIVAYDWYWIDPDGDKKSDKIEASEVSFDITKAMPKLVTPTVADQTEEDEDKQELTEEQQSAGSQAQELAAMEKVFEIPIEEMAMWTPEEIELKFSSGEITEECYKLLSDIDTVSSKLLKLKEAHDAVLFRPLPVASNGLYWWGKDEKAYKWLWKLMYTRMTKYHKLNNLIWVWSAQNADWYVGDEYCDVLSVDIYTDGNRDAQINTMLFLNNLCRTKPLAISECGNLPAMESVLQEKALWSYTALWDDPYFSLENGTAVNDEATSKAYAARFKEYYNNNYTLTREELPNLADVAKGLKASDKADKAAAKKAEEEAAKKETEE
ncbi:MAG: glycosyl hydrolase [Oscillospiraceae bacterium]